MSQPYRNYQSKGTFTPGKPKTELKPKIIYAEDELYAGKTKTGYYLFHTTLDPSETYKQRRIGDLTERPAKEFVLEKVIYGQMDDKVKWRLDKEKLKEWVEEEYKFVFSEKPSPWAPKKLGVKRTPAEADLTDSDTEPDEPTQKKTKIEVTELAGYEQLVKTINDCYTLLLEVTNHMRQEKAKSSAGDSSE
jgi:hypothetical protein